MDKYSLFIFDVVLHYQLNVFKIPKMVQYNHRSPVISVNYAKYIHLILIFCTFQNVYIASINHSKIHFNLTLQQMLVKLFFSYRIIGILCNLNKDTQLVLITLKSILKQFVFIQLTSYSNNCNHLHRLMAKNGNARNFCVSYSNRHAFYRPELNL